MKINIPQKHIFKYLLKSVLKPKYNKKSFRLKFLQFY